MRMSVRGPRPTPRGLRAASPLTEVHRPRARQAVDVVGAPAYDPLLTCDESFYILQPKSCAQSDDLALVEGGDESGS